MKRFLTIPALLLITACGGNTAAIAVASLGIAGAGLTAYCASSPCSPDVVKYAGTIITEATKDAAILESGTTTADQVSQIIANLNADLQTGQVLADAPPQVRAIVAAITAVLPLVEALLPKTPAAGSFDVSGSPVVIKLPKLSAQDHAKMAEMRVKIMAAKR